MGIFFAIAASLFCTFSNFCMRRSQDHGGTSKTAVMLQMTSAFFMMVLINPVRMNAYSLSPSIMILGLISGIVFGGMLYFIGKALERGPAGLTFATMDSATVLPSIFLFFTVGNIFSLKYHLWHGAGTLLVVIGLFWAARQYTQMKSMKDWLTFTFTAFSLHVLFLMLVSFRSLVLNFPEQSIPFLSAEELKSLWFMPLIYLISSVIQIQVFLKQPIRSISKREWTYGILGGIANACSTFFIIKSSECASTIERAMIFPVFSVLVTVFSYAWGQKLYQEKVNWKACQLSILGLIIGTVDWEILFK